MNANSATADEILLLFDAQYPCWTVAMFELSGVSRELVASLRAQGFLIREEDIYFLSDTGRARFETLAQESWLPIMPGILDKNNKNNNEENKHTAFACELKYLLDKRHMQRWGLKEYELPFIVTIPDLRPEKIFQLEDELEHEPGRVRWLWPEHPFFTALRNTNHDTLTSDIIAQIQIAMRELKFDLLYKSRYDFQMYAHFKPVSTDKYGFLNVDRFLFSIPPAREQSDIKFYLTRIGEFQMFFDLVRHVYLPGFTDRDALEQDCVNWLLFAFVTEKEAQACAELLTPFQKDLNSSVTGTTPTEIWTVSLECLKQYPNGTLETLETIWDLLPFVAHPVCRLK